MSTIGELIRSKAAANGDRELLSIGAERLTYAELDARTDAMAAACRALLVFRWPMIAHLRSGRSAKYLAFSDAS